MMRIASRVLLGLALWVAVLAFVVPGGTGRGAGSAPGSTVAAWGSSSSPFGGVTAAAATSMHASGTAASASATPGTSTAVAAPIVTSQPRRDVIYAAYLLVLVGACAIVLWAAWGGRRRPDVDLTGAPA